MTVGPCVVGVHAYVQLSRPVAGCHVVPPSTDTSTPATAPRSAGVLVESPTPKSWACPLIVAGVPTWKAAGTEPMVDAGGVVSPDAVAANNPTRKLPG